MQLPQLQELLAGFKPAAEASYPLEVQKALFVARRLQERAAALQTAAERRRQAELSRMVHQPADKATVVQMTDQAFRTNDPRRALEHLVHILDVQGIPQFLGSRDRALMRLLRSFGGYLPGLTLPLVKEHIRKEAANVILPGERDELARHLRRRTAEGVRMNVNFLGEAILSEAEAERRLHQYLVGLEWPEIEVVSIKISTLYSQISPLAREHTLATLCKRLERLFQAAQRARFTRPNGEVVSKFVYLDMEEYRDKDLTAAIFMRALEGSGLSQARAGIALQSYLPDSFPTLLELQQWARRRVAAGGGRVTVRLVKGANLESERVEASLRGWPQAPYRSKLEADANYKRMLQEALKPENLAALDVGVASHNLFDVAYGLVLAGERNALDRVQFEMLEGMAEPQRRALLELTHNLLLYAPACKEENFLNAIGYLIRRLDENTAPENFLRHVFQLTAGSPDWQKLEQGFLASLEAIPNLSQAPRRTQNRQVEEGRAVPSPPPDNPGESPGLAEGWQQFRNEPDTDFALPQNGEWAQQIIARWEPRWGERAPHIPLVIDGMENFAGNPLHDCLDPSRPGVVVGHYRQATEEEINRAVETAVEDPDGWRRMLPRERFALLGEVAQELRQSRGELLGAALANGGKTFTESDPEVSEAVDFLELYRATARWWQEMPTFRAQGKGVVVVVSPWNFPIAIPCGGVAAALAAGNTVILKPASDTVLVAWELCQCFWRAGISRSVLQFVPCSGGREGRKLVNHPKVNAVILTGGTQTALSLFRENPRLQLFAETGGKDATIVTAISDREQAIKHVLHSAFSHSGQKCSATSLLLLEAEVYDAPEFRRALCEAAQSLKVGSAWRLETKVGPLIRLPSGDLQNALTKLEPGEEWALKPRPAEGNPNLWTPGIKYGVQPGSYTHLTEFFGPVLAVMRFTDLAEAVTLVNQTGYGLTSGLESLDEREWDYWKEHVRAGNLYINRVTTGAVVLRQPFGGFGKSVFGPGLKAGGPNYVAQLMDFTDVSSVVAAGVSPAATSEPYSALCRELSSRSHPDADRLAAAVLSYEASVREEFGKDHDHFHLLGQDNFRRYLSVGRVRVRLHPQDTPFELFARVCAARIAGNGVAVSIPPGPESSDLALLKEQTKSWGDGLEFIEEDDKQLAKAVRERQTDRLRYAAGERVPLVVLQAAEEAGVAVVSAPVSCEGRLELLWYLHEQSLSIDYHRYGNLGARAAEARAKVL